MFSGKHEHTHFASSMPGRTRVRVSQKRRTKEEMGRLVHALNDRLKSAEARVNVQTGSILLHHPENSLEDVRAALEDLGVVMTGISGLYIPWTEGKTRAAYGLTAALSDLNRRLGLATHGVVNLQLLVPFGLGALALAQLLRYGWQFQTAPWYVLAYASFDSFIKLHYSREMEPVGRSSGEDAGSVH
jgi:hypothetical protein